MSAPKTAVSEKQEKMPEFPTGRQLGLSKCSFPLGAFLQYSAVPLWMCNTKPFFFPPAFQSWLTPFPYLAALSGTSQGLGFLLRQLLGKPPQRGSRRAALPVAAVPRGGCERSPQCFLQTFSLWRPCKTHYLQRGNIPRRVYGDVIFKGYFSSPI